MRFALYEILSCIAIKESLKCPTNVFYIIVLKRNPPELDRSVCYIRVVLFPTQDEAFHVLRQLSPTFSAPVPGALMRI